MSNEKSCPRSLWRTVVMAALLGACGPTEEGAVEEGGAGLGTAQQEALTGVTLGLANIGGYTQGSQPLSTHADQVFCEFNQLGAKWARLMADAADTNAATYQSIVQKARAKNVKTLVTVPARYCGADTDTAAISAFTTSYVNHLNDLATTVFTGTAAVDGFEIGNESNVQEQGCGDSVTRYRVSPNAFAHLLRAVWNWKTANSRPELIVSGGMRNTYLTEAYWTPFFNSTAFSANKGSRPFDYFGIHPYNPTSLDVQCINTGSSACFSTWKYNVTNGLKSVASRVNTATGTTGSLLFATEFGFQMAGKVLAPGTPTCGANNCVLNPLQMAAGMQAAGDALVASAVTPLGLWTGYRDEASTRFGLRDGWNGDKYPAAKLDPKDPHPTSTGAWNKYRNLAGGSTNTNTELCWNLNPQYFPLVFESGDARRTTVTYEWFQDNYKSECGPGERALGLSKSTAGGWARTLLCYKDAVDSSRYTHPAPDQNPDTEDPVIPYCNGRSIVGGTSRGSTVSGDWDPGQILAECGDTEYVAGVSQSTDNKLSGVLCCPTSSDWAPLPARVSGVCTARPFATADNRETTVSGNWDASAYKGECGTGSYIAGVSRNADGQPSAILCCNQ